MAKSSNGWWLIFNSLCLAKWLSHKHIHLTSTLCTNYILKNYMSTFKEIFFKQLFYLLIFNINVSRHHYCFWYHELLGTLSLDLRISQTTCWVRLSKNTGKLLNLHGMFRHLKEVPCSLDPQKTTETLSKIGHQICRHKWEDLWGEKTWEKPGQTQHKKERGGPKNISTWKRKSGTLHQK